MNGIKMLILKLVKYIDDALNIVIKNAIGIKHNDIWEHRW